MYNIRGWLRSYTYGHAACIGCQNELFQIGREHWHRSHTEHTTQNFLPWLDKGKCQKQIRRLFGHWYRQCCGDSELRTE